MPCVGLNKKILAAINDVIVAVIDFDRSATLWDEPQLIPEAVPLITQGATRVDADLFNLHSWPLMKDEPMAPGSDSFLGLPVIQDPGTGIDFGVAADAENKINTLHS